VQFWSIGSSSYGDDVGDHISIHDFLGRSYSTFEEGDPFGYDGQIILLLRLSLSPGPYRFCWCVKGSLFI
jgi:hypothetical protein